MKIRDIDRPADLRCDEIWGLYKLLENLDEHYIFYDRCNEPKDNEELFYLEKTELGDDGVEYSGPDNMGFILPCSKKEWVKLTMSHYENGRYRQYECKIKVNALFKSDRLPISELLTKNHIRIPNKEELNNYEFKEYYSRVNEFPMPIPEVYYMIPFSKKDPSEKQSQTVAYWLLKYLRYNYISYKEDTDNGTRRLTFVFMNDKAPGGFVEGCVWFYNEAAEVRVYYNQIGADICKKSKYKSELMSLLNFINSRVFIGLKEWENSGNYSSRMLYTPRMYLTDDECYDITITTMINYKFWEIERDNTHNYITAYCPELLNILSPYIFSLLSGNINLEEAVKGIKKEILKDNLEE